MKIFGIGLSRTGTTSLNKALEILGYKSIHWPSNNQILTDICDGRFKWDILQTYDALTDIHGAAFYREFDKEYLNSKFILTVRDELSWINSIKKHVKILDIKNKIKKGKINSPMTVIMLLIVWGQLNPNPEEMLYRYQKHIEEVKIYFKDRKDLLEINIPAGDGWEKLCNFLDKPIPKVSFPKENSS